MARYLGMKVIGRVLVLAAAGVLGVGAAFASGGRRPFVPTVPAPTISTPITTVTAPKVTTPTVTVPTVTAPRVTVTTPTVPTPTVTAPRVTTPTPTVTAPRVTTPTPTVTAPRVTTPTPTVTAPRVTTPTPTVTAPRVTTSTPTRPTVTASTPTAPKITNSTPTVPKATVTPTTATQQPAAQASGQAGSSSSHAVAGISAARGARAHVSAARVGFKTAVAHFRLGRAVRVHVVVRELAPICRRIGSYSFAARRGRNNVRVPVRVARHRLGVGMYALVGRTRAGRKVFEAHAQVVTRKVQGEARRMLLVRRGAVADRCSAPTPAGGSPIVDPPAGKAAAVSHGVLGAFVPPKQPSAPSSPIIRAISLSDTPRPFRSLMLVLLVISIGLLSVAAVPQRALPAGPFAAAIARRRTHLALAGIWLLALLAFVIAFT